MPNKMVKVKGHERRYKNGNKTLVTTHSRSLKDGPPLKNGFSYDWVKKFLKRESQENKVCIECQGTFPLEVMYGRCCPTCHDDKEIIDLWRKGNSEEEILDVLDVSYDRILNTINGEVVRAKLSVK